MSESLLLRLHPDDNVLTVLRPLPPGTLIEVGGTKVHITKPLGLGHKIAATKIASGAKVIKYGVPIGSAICDIAAGEHVHTHNLQSDYLPTWSRENQTEWFAAHTAP
jgi:hypothetical protein